MTVTDQPDGGASEPGPASADPTPLSTTTVPGRRPRSAKVSITFVCLGVAVLVTAFLTQSRDASSAAGPVVFHATITVTSDIHVKESFTDKTTATNVRSCAQAAAHGDRPQMGPNTWLVPTPTLDDPVEIQIGTKARRYHGPGHYPRSALVQGNGAMDVGPESFDLTSADATVSMNVSADGSGNVTFTHVPGDDDSPHRGWTGGISGTITWTCSS